MGLTLEQRRSLFTYDRNLALDVRTTAIETVDGLHVERFSFAGAGLHGERVPALLYRQLQPEAPLPVVVIGHGARQSKDEPGMNALFAHWAGAGLACLCIDAPLHGERGDRDLDLMAMVQRPTHGLEFAVRTVVDTEHAVDWIETRPDLDAARIAYTGFSLGSILGVQFVAMESRVRTAVFALGGAGLIHYLALKAPAEAREEAERVADALDPIHYAPLIAPRPVLMVNGLHDEIIPAALGHMLFYSLGEPRRIIWYEGGHGDIPHEHFHEMRLFLEAGLAGSDGAARVEVEAAELSAG